MKEAVEVRLRATERTRGIEGGARAALGFARYVLARFRRDLDEAGKLEELAEDLANVEEINRCKLAHRLYRFDVGDVKDMLLAAGFSNITAETDRAYAGQAMIVCARK